MQLQPTAWLHNRDGICAAQVSATIMPCIIWHWLCKLPFTGISADVERLRAKGYVTEDAFRLDGQLSAAAVSPDNTYGFYEPVVRHLMPQAGIAMPKQAQCQ